MSRSTRLSAQWFNRGLWLVAVLFAAFLIGLGGTIVGDLPKVEQGLQRESFMDADAAAPLRRALRDADAAGAAADGDMDEATLRLQAEQQAYDSGLQSFRTWVETRKATGLTSQDAELVSRARALDALKAERDDGQRRVDALTARKRAAEADRAAAEGKLDQLQYAADRDLAAAENRAELRVFLYRLALTLPLLAIAGWLLVRHRRGTWWPFVWGFAFFAFYAFFVELVPYLPSYGGYVHYIVGIIVTVVAGRYTILALNRYLAQMKAAEQQPDQLRRQVLDYDTALLRLSKGVCPSCERAVDLGNTDNDFCPHCGIGLFDHCPACARRKNAFARFCHGCGAPADPPEVAVPD